MRFEHLVQINDPLMPLLTPLSREQLWRGLVARAHDPCQFVTGLIGATVETLPAGERTSRLARVLDFGAFQVHDQVVLTPMVCVVHHVEAGEDYPASRLTIGIEEPAEDALFLRFTYVFEEAGPQSALDEVTESLRRQAYERADLDTVQRIREMAEDGLLEPRH